ncbi:hypothetical protein [Acinetobacter nosocomialis]|uniref:hypothetical protein n=1 Tax=Acinetobacter nosocomialis TaxID=106654 RepID=UPI0021CF5F3D|nr:hypothetical protein [Acinetobacter nosocomialis]
MFKLIIILFYLLGILGVLSILGGVLTLSFFLIIIGLGLICAALLLKKEFKIDVLFWK